MSQTVALLLLMAFLFCLLAIFALFGAFMSAGGCQLFHDALGCSK